MRDFMNLLEAGTKTADIDIKAKAALTQDLSKFFEQTIYDYAEKFAESRQDQSESRRDIHAAYDDFCNRFNNGGDYWDDGHAFGRALVEDALLVASRSLTKLCLEYDKSTFTSIEVKEWSKDPHKDQAGGYYIDGKIVVFVNQYAIASACLHGISAAITGERIDELINLIKPTFVHEFAHFLQDKDGQFIHSRGRDRGYTHVSKDRQRRSPHKGAREYVHYLGSAYEIDSFASDTASMLHDNLMAYGRTSLSQDSVRSALDDLAHGYMTGNASRYFQLTQDAFNGRYAEIGLKPAEARKTFNRFLKLVYSKLHDYAPDKGAKQGEYPLEYFTWAKQGFAKAVQKIAYSAASAAEDNYDLSYQVSRAWRFIEEHFVGQERDYEKVDRMNDRFRAYVQRVYDSMREWEEQAVA